MGSNAQTSNSVIASSTPPAYVRIAQDGRIVAKPEPTVEDIKRDIAILRKHLERTDLTEAEREEIRDDIHTLALGAVLADIDKD